MVLLLKTAVRLKNWMTKRFEEVDMWETPLGESNEKRFAAQMIELKMIQNIERFIIEFE